MKEEFIQGCLNHGFTQEKAIEVFGLIEKFADYGFNKSHSVAYGYVAYQLAYLKANYPLYFLHRSYLMNYQVKIQRCIVFRSVKLIMSRFYHRQSIILRLVLWWKMGIFAILY